MPRLGVRWGVFLVGLAASVALTVVFWPRGAFLFLLLPLFLPLRWRGRTPVGRACPRCGFSSRDPGVRFCPRDGTALGS